MFYSGVRNFVVSAKTKAASTEGVLTENPTRQDVELDNYWLRFRELVPIFKRIPNERGIQIKPSPHIRLRFLSRLIHKKSPIDAMASLRCDETNSISLENHLLWQPPVEEAPRYSSWCSPLGWRSVKNPFSNSKRRSRRWKRCWFKSIRFRTWNVPVLAVLSILKFKYM